MAQPLDLPGLGLPGHRNTALVPQTRDAIRPFTEGRADIEVGQTGTISSVPKPQDKGQTQNGIDDATDGHLRSRIGRRFRSF